MPAPSRTHAELLLNHHLPLRQQQGRQNAKAFLQNSKVSWLPDASRDWSPLLGGLHMGAVASHAAAPCQSLRP